MEGSSYFADSVLTTTRCARLARQNRISIEQAPGTVFLDQGAYENITPPAVEEIELPEVSYHQPPAATDTTGNQEAARPTHASSEDDTGENRLIHDYGPARIHGREKMDVVTEWWAASRSRYQDPPTALDRYTTDEHGLRHRVIYDPTEMARLLQPHRRQSSGARWCLAALLETALDPGRPGCESLLILKAVTDAYLVTSRGRHVDIHAIDDGNDFLQPLEQAWQHAVGHRDRHADHQHTSVDLHVTASWFQAWAASYEVHEVLPGDWTWVLDHLQSTGAPEGIPHLEEELRLEAAEERTLWLPRDIWSLDDLKRSLRLVSDEAWFQEGGGMLDFRVFGPSRPSTFARVFSDIPGAIYGCLKGHDGVTLTPPTFRMYTSGDIFEALGAEAVVRYRDVGGGTAGEAEIGEPKSKYGTGAMRRQVVSVVEIQVTWLSGYTHVLGWLEAGES